MAKKEPTLQDVYVMLLTTIDKYHWVIKSPIHGGGNGHWYTSVKPFDKIDDNGFQPIMRRGNDLAHVINITLEEIIPNYTSLYELSQGHFRNDGGFAKVIKGSIKSFTDAHGYQITNDNVDSLVKRILRGIANAVKQSPREPYKHGGGAFTSNWINDYHNITQFRG